MLPGVSFLLVDFVVVAFFHFYNSGLSEALKKQLRCGHKK